MTNLARILATAPADELRDGPRAVEIASEACELTDYKTPGVLYILAAAHAETGDFDAAVKWSEKALELLGEKDDPKQRESLLAALELYQTKKPMRQEPPQTNDQPR